MVCLENNPRPFCCFCDYTNILYFGWLTSRNQDCWENYQQPQICRWHHSTGRKWGGTKESLDDGERQWKSWLETQHSNNQYNGIWSHHFIANWRGSGSSDILYFLGSKITSNINCSHEIQRRLLLGRNVMINKDRY